MPNTPCGNSSISPAIARSTPCTRAMPSPIEMTRADFGDVDFHGVAADLVANDLGDFFGSDIHTIPVGGIAGLRVAIAVSSRSRTSGELRRDAAVVHRAADPRHHAADDRRVDLGRQRDRAAGRVRQPLLQLRRAAPATAAPRSSLRRGRPAGAPSAARDRRRAGPASSARRSRSASSSSSLPPASTAAARVEQLLDDGALAAAGIAGIRRARCCSSGCAVEERRERRPAPVRLLRRSTSLMATSNSALRVARRGGPRAHDVHRLLADGMHAELVPRKAQAICLYHGKRGSVIAGPGLASRRRASALSRPARSAARRSGSARLPTPNIRSRIVHAACPRRTMRTFVPRAKRSAILGGARVDVVAGRLRAVGAAGLARFRASRVS